MGMTTNMSEIFAGDFWKLWFAAAGGGGGGGGVGGGAGRGRGDLGGGGCVLGWGATEIG